MKITVVGPGIDPYSYNSPICPEIGEKILYKRKTYTVRSITHIVEKAAYASLGPSIEEIEVKVGVS